MTTYHEIIRKSILLTFGEPHWFPMKWRLGLSKLEWGDCKENWYSVSDITVTLDIPWSRMLRANREYLMDVITALRGQRVLNVHLTETVWVNNNKSTMSIESLMWFRKSRLMMFLGLTLKCWVDFRIFMNPVVTRVLCYLLHNCVKCVQEAYAVSTDPSNTLTASPISI